VARLITALEHDPEKWVPVFPRDKRQAFAQRSCSNKKIEHDPEKWVPVFRKDHAQNKKIGRDDDSKNALVEHQ
jgi:hypothetical protein